MFTHNNLYKLLLPVLGLFLTLFMCEITFRVLPTNLTGLDLGLREEIRKFDDTKVYAYKASSLKIWTGLGDPAVWHFNNLGYRERDVQTEIPQGNFFRIAVLGDSMVMGLGVEDYQAFPRRLEELLKHKVVKHGTFFFEVLNFGVLGYTGSQYKAVLEEDVLKLRPDIVLVGLFPNDPQEEFNLHMNNKYSLLRSIPDSIPGNEFLRQNSYAYIFLLGRYYNAIDTSMVVTESNSRNYQAGWEMLKDSLVEINDIARNNNIRIIFLNIPIFAYVNNSQESDWSKNLAVFAEENGFEYLDLVAGLKKYPNIEELFINSSDDHFSPTGNEYVAKLIADYLVANSLVPKPPQ